MPTQPTPPRFPEGSSQVVEIHARIVSPSGVMDYGNDVETARDDFDALTNPDARIEYRSVTTITTPWAATPPQHQR